MLWDHGEDILAEAATLQLYLANRDKLYASWFIQVRDALLTDQPRVRLKTQQRAWAAFLAWRAHQLELIAIAENLVRLCKHPPPGWPRESEEHRSALLLAEHSASSTQQSLASVTSMTEAVIPKEVREGFPEILEPVSNSTSARET